MASKPTASRDPSTWPNAEMARLHQSVTELIRATDESDDDRKKAAEEAVETDLLRMLQSPVNNPSPPMRWSMEAIAAGSRLAATIRLMLDTGETSLEDAEKYGLDRKFKDWLRHMDPNHPMLKEDTAGGYYVRSFLILGAV